MAKKAKKKEKSFLNKVLWRLFGAFIITFTLAAFVSLIGYDAMDASSNVATARQINNYLGSFGSKLADFIVSYWGISLAVFLVAPISWGYNCLRLREFLHPYTRIMAFFLGSLFLSIFLGLLPSEYFGQYKLGGSIGHLFASLSMNSSNIFNFPFRREILLFVSFCLTMLSFNFAVGITYKTWYKGFRAIVVYTWKFLRLCFRIIALGISKIKFSRNREETDELVVKPEKEKAPKERKEPKVKEEKEETPTASQNKAAPKPAKKKDIDDGYMYPDVNLLSRPKDKGGNLISEKELESIARDLENVLQEFGVNGKIVKVRPGPVVTLYELEPAPGTKTARVIGLADDIARSMSAVSVRIAVVPGQSVIGIEMPNEKRADVYLKEMFACDEFKNATKPLLLALGKDIGGKPTFADLAKMPHLLVAGTTGSGKSVAINTMILSLVYRLTPDQVRLIMVDPKMLELSVYNGIPHLLTPVVTDPKKAVLALNWAVREMDDRYRQMSELGVRNIDGYNAKVKEMIDSKEPMTRTVLTGYDNGEPVYEEQPLNLKPFPYIVVIVDEMADLMVTAGKEIEIAVQRIAQKARAAGIHLILATQRPSVDVITGTIKANFPERISFRLTTKIDSRTILGEQGAEQLLGRGDMLYLAQGQRPVRLHGPFVSDAEVEAVTAHLRLQGVPEYEQSVTEEPPEATDGTTGDFDNGEGASLYDKAVAIVLRDRKVSTSYIQRQLRIGYNRAADLIDQMEAQGVISAPSHAGKREILVPDNR